MNLNDLRIEIDECNKQLFQVIKKRFEITRKVGRLKAEENLPAYDKERESRIIKNIREMAKNEKLNPDMMENIFKIIMTEVVKEHQEIKNEYKNDK